MIFREYLERLLGHVAENVNWKNYDIDSNIDQEIGNGFSGDFFLASITNKDTKEKLEVAIKKSQNNQKMRDEFNMGRVFETEICFYREILPALLKFKGSRGGPLDIFPKYLGCLLGDNTESFAMENLKISGFNIIGRSNFLDEELVQFIFKTYGKFHALTFAFKDQNPKEYQRLTEGLYDVLATCIENEGFLGTIQNACQSAFDCVNAEIQEAGKAYINDTKNKYYEGSTYKGKYSCLVHGDCWSNNMMFKYEDSKLVNMKLIDFQLTKNDTPVHDLSYFLYAGGTKESFQNLDKYLELYYESFSKMCKDLGSDPQVIYPFEALKEDWAKYCKWGLIMGLMLNKMKMTEEEQIKDFLEGDFFDAFAKIKISEEKNAIYKKKINDLLEHVYTRGFL